MTPKRNRICVWQQRFCGLLLAGLSAVTMSAAAADEFPKPYSPPCTERENVFEFTEKPAVKTVGPDKYEISFSVKGNCDVTAAIVDDQRVVIRHLGSGVLGPNAPAPFQKNSLKQTIYWNGKDDLGDYVKEPMKMKVRVSLGLKPVFDKLLGTWDPHNVPGVVIGLVVGEGGAYVFSKGGGAHDHTHLRKFDHDGNYLQSLVPPPSNLPAEKLQGCGYIEYEPGKRALHGSKVLETLAGDGFVLAGFDGHNVVDQRPALAQGRLYCLNGGSGYYQGKKPSMLYYLFTDGSTDVAGQKGRPFITRQALHENARLAASPDGSVLYMCNPGQNVVFQFSTQGDKPAEVLMGGGGGKDKKSKGNDPGSDNEHLNNPVSLDCDAQGRIYVSDSFNNRLQIFAPDGKHLKTIPMDRPGEVHVHRKSGAIYLFHAGEVQGRSVPRLTKFTSFENPKEEFHVDNLVPGMTALDSWTPKPRLWFGGGGGGKSYPGFHISGANVTIWEEDGGTLKKIVDFDEIAKKGTGEDEIGRWSTSVFDHVDCDPTRERVYFQGFRGNPRVFDLKTGKRLIRVRLRNPMNDLAFDKRGYMHCHIDPGFGIPGVGRVDPDQSAPAMDYYKGQVMKKYDDLTEFKEVPYDYGVELSKPQTPGWIGGIPVKDQPGAKYFQDGFGVNMKGELVVQSNIYFVPRMDEAGFGLAMAGADARAAAGGGAYGDSGRSGLFAQFVRNIQEKERLGEEVFYIPRKPGIPLCGATAWTYERNGEVRQASAVTAGGTLAGTLIDEDGMLYFTASRTKLYNGKVFLNGQKGYYGSDKPLQENDRNPFTSTYFKTRGKDVVFLSRGAAVPLDAPPARPTDVVTGGPFGDAEFGGGEMWVEGAEWMYAGAGPVIASGCTCASMRSHLDWYKRSYVPESYRHSLGILDTNGNLIMHLGRYGNNDDALAMKSGTDDVRLFLPRFISGTDNYLAFDDWGERLVVLKLNYQAEESAGIK
ncbi:MAG: hypothetical protein C0404_02355 [Verrucomicrobia bacterium]|nr:hypothetical protein [Verrucomicrobiota bacterium]